VKPRSFRLEEDGAVARITLDRPQSLNSLTFEIYEELTALFRSFAARHDLRCATITGAGRAFCTGGDVREIIGPLLGRGASERLAFTRLTCGLILAMRAAPQPIVAVLNGVVAGAGAAIAVAADLRIAAASARIGFVFVKVGLAGADMGMCRILPRLVGLGRAAELLMTGDFLDAAEAHRIGLYNAVVPEGELRGRAEKLVQALVRGPAAGLAATKRALEDEATMSLDEALDHEARLQAALMDGADFAEGYQAFVARRPPRFGGAPE
jgi:enoyl-CoA hydratase/carnithine racemase